LTRRGLGLAVLALALATRPLGAAPADRLGTVVTAVAPDGTRRQYLLDRHLASGFFSHGYAGHEVATGARVAIKVMRSKWRAHAQAFRREEAIMQQVNHASLPRAHGVGATASGETALVMDFVEGAPLGLRGTIWTPRPQARAVRITLRILEAIDALERRGLHHNDVHAENVLIDRERPDSVRLIDLGNASSREERKRGNSDTDVAAQLLVHMITGQPSASAVTQISDAGLRAVLERATSGDATRRYRNARQLIDALRPFTGET
jgi:serine/threonine protein kinase